MAAMAWQVKRWTLEDLIDFEHALAADPKPSASVKATVREAARGLDGAASRRSGLRAWLDVSKREPSAGRKFSMAILMLRMLLILIGWAIGAGAVRSIMDREIGGMNVVHFLAILIGFQWLILLVASVGLAFGRRAAGGFTAVQILIGKIIRRRSGSERDDWWTRLIDGGAVPRAALLWRIAQLAQVFGIWFNIGIVSALAAFVLTKNVGFYWETTTEVAMRDGLSRVVHFLAFPWSAFWSAAVPDGAVIDATRLFPKTGVQLAPGPEAWWLFLLMVTFVWGLLPRLILWFLAGNASRAALAKLDFQGRHHRALWRELSGIDRVESDEKPLDGVLVLDVGGSGLKPESLRPFLLQKLRVHPAAWQPVAVLDAGAESQASAALALAPAGVVLLGEGWALSPPRMTALHARIRAAAGSETPVKFLVANEAGGQPVSPSEEERKQWERFVDSLRDPLAEVYFYQT